MTLPTGPAVDPVAIARSEVQQCSATQPYIDLAESIGATILSGCAGPELKPAIPPRSPVAPTDATTALAELVESANPSAARGFFCALPDYSVLSVSGADAISFLHAQVTNDLAALASHEVQLNGYCTAKGRLLATAMTWRQADAVHLLVPSAHCRSLATRLRKYVMRAKVSIQVPDDLAILGIAQCAAASVLESLGVTAPAEMRTSEPGERFSIGLMPVRIDGQVWTRHVLMVPASQLLSVWQNLSTHLTPGSTANWRWLEVLSGVPRIVGGAVEQFVPQMINLERVEGVNFKKGCYPGQEVVARSQYLGKLKRRMFLASSQCADITPGQDVYALGQTEPAGQVVLAAPVPEWLAKGSEGAVPEPASVSAKPTQLILFEASRDVVAQSAANAALRMGHPEGDSMHELPLPYEL